MNTLKFWTVVFVLTAAGCSGSSDRPQLGIVSGNIVVNGKPAAHVSVNFIPAGTGRGSTAVTDDQGYYYLKYTADADGAIVGKHTVKLTNHRDNVDSMPTAEELAKFLPKEILEISKECEVKQGKNKLDFTFP